MNIRTLALLGGVGALAALGLSSCNEASTLARPAAPVTLTGAQVPSFIGVDPSRLVAFRHTVVDGNDTWTQIPVQVDQRKDVPFGAQPSSNTTPGVTGTVYGNGTGGPTALQYADPNTWVGADTDPLIDADDEITFMGFDAGGMTQANPTDPAHTVGGSGIGVKITDPRNTAEKGWVFLFQSDGTLDPAAGQDYVNYQFNLTSGAYKSTYLRADGPNPETSTVTTASYQIGLTDRWKETSWKVLAAGASGVDILDGHKNQFATTTCGRSNATFADAEGAFVANIDGPVRAIRSYVGANSGPLTQRTHIFYRDREDVITDLRVHAIPGIMDFLDYSAAASGMTYRSSTLPGGVAIDGVNDSVPSGLPTWEAVNGSQGRVYTANSFTSSQAGLDAGTVAFYEDHVTPDQPECWGDGSYYAASGAWIQTGIGVTDPRTPPFGTLQGVRVNQFLPPAADPGAIATDAGDWAQDLTTPLTVETTPFLPAS